MSVRKRKRAQIQKVVLPRAAPESLGELVSLREIVATGAVSEATVRRGYRTGALVGFIPAGRTAGRSGRLGYRFRKADVLAWLYGTPQTPQSPEVDSEAANK
jgi:hypothetical protein